MDLKKYILYKMLVKYYLSDNIKAPFENFALGLENAWAGPVHDHEGKWMKDFSINWVSLLLTPYFAIRI